MVGRGEWLRAGLTGRELGSVGFDLGPFLDSRGVKSSKIKHLVGSFGNTEIELASLTVTSEHARPSYGNADNLIWASG